ncbi:MAG: hypothetical protein AB7E37_02520 [Candidatus Altimarinota bacterium]
MFKKFFNSQKQISGIIGYFGLGDWWQSSFSKEEQDYIISKYNPLGGNGESLVEGKPTYVSGNIVSLLGGLSGWFSNENDFNIGFLFLGKGEDLINKGIAISKIDLHFFYADQINFYYKFRNNKGFYDNFIDSCKKQINISNLVAKEMKLEYGDKLPKHTGYEKLIFVFSIEGKKNEVIELSLKAKSEGWNGDWEKFIEKIAK